MNTNNSIAAVPQDIAYQLCADIREEGKRVLGANGEHLKLVLYDGRQTWDAIAFRQGAWHNHLPPCADVAYTLEVNEWNGRSQLQLNVKDIKPAEEAG